MVTRPAFTDRVQHVELRIAGEILAVGLILFLFFSALPALSWAPRATVSLALLAAASLSLYRRWRQRLTRWHALTNWSIEPLRRDGPLVAQANSSGEPTTVIDTRERYTVTARPRLVAAFSALGKLEFIGELERRDFRSIATKIEKDECYRKRLLSDDPELPRLWRRR